MEEDSIQKQLQIFFPKPARDEWKKIAMQETNGKDPFEALAWYGKDNIKFLPYYDAQHVAHLRNSSEDIPAANRETLYQWLNIPAIAVSDEAEANLLAHKQLSHGADGLFFYLDPHTAAQIGPLLSGIERSSSKCFFRIHDDQHFQKIFAAETPDTLHQINGGLFWESIPKTSNLADSFTRRAEFRSLGLVISASTPGEEIATALMNGVLAFERFASKSSPEDVLQAVSFSLPADVSFLESVAKIKALRRLWWQIAHSYGHNDYNVEDLHIHVRSLSTPDAMYGPRENMLKATFASMAAVAGGCDSLTIEGENTPLFQRWAANVSNILGDESFFGRIADPLGGAYAAEAMVDGIAQKAWQSFQLKMKTA